MNKSELAAAKVSVQQFEIAKQLNDFSTRSIHWDKYNFKQKERI